MTTSTSPLPRERFPILLLALAAAVFVWLAMRNHGLAPVVFADEWYYSKMARLQPLAETTLPSYLYLWLFRATNACGTGFLDCARYGNELFYVAAAPFVYLVAREVTSRRLALFVTALSLLAPFNIYTLFFMPEAMYYFGFAVLSWVALTRARWGWWRHGLACGLVLGLMSLVKVHALFLVPALVLYLLAAPVLGSAGGSRRSALAGGAGAAALAVAMTLAIKYGLGYLLAGDTALSLYGKFYAGAANNASGTTFGRLLAPIFINGRGHLAALAVLMALPLATILYALFSPAARAQAGTRVTQLQLYTLLMLGAAVGMTVVYTASIANVGPTEVVRLHLRYYNYNFPLLLIIAAAFARPREGAPAQGKRPVAWAVVLPIAIVLLFALVKLPTYSLSPIDGPDIMAVDLKKASGKLVVALELLALFLWARGSRRAADVFLFGVVPLTTALGLSTINYYLRPLDQGFPPDKAGQFAHRHVPAAEHGQITVAITDDAQGMRTQFFIDHADASLMILPKDAPIETYQLPVRNKWLLVVGPHALPEGIKPVAATADYKLVQVNTNRRTIGTASFATPLRDDGLVSAVEGLSHQEGWGRWSEGKQVVLHFSQPLPPRATIILKAQAFDVNTTLPFVMRVGDQAQRFRLGVQPQDIALPFTTDGNQRTLTIEVPRPTAPRDVSGSIDDRLLGIGMVEIEVAARDD